MNTVLKASTLYNLILFILFPVVLIDIGNGILIENGIDLPLSISQLYKLIVIACMIIVLLLLPKYVLYIGLIFFTLLFPTLYQLTKNGFDFNLLFNDIIKISKYLTIPISFFFFKSMFITNSENLNKRSFTWIIISYSFLSISLLLSIIGLGYPMYEAGTIGTRGFFVAGNEISALLLVLYSIIAFNIWHKYSKLLYVLFIAFNIYLGLLITSKTGIIGTLLIGVLIPINLSKNRFTPKQLLISALTVLIIIPTTIYYIIRFISKSSLMIRLEYFWNKLDIFTFIFSSRNIYLKDMIPIYLNHYDWVEKIIGKGQTQFEEFNNQSIIEIDSIDIYFAYGILGIVVLILSLYLLIVNSYKFRKYSPYGKLSFLMIIMLLILSNLSGHILNSGIAGIFIGFLFSLFYLKDNGQKNSTL